MILGIGIDLVDIRRIEKLLKAHEERFEQKIFAEIEQAKARTSSHPAASYAKRYAAKEAAAKALGTGFRDGIFLSHIVVENDANGAPQLHFYGEAKKRLEAMIPAGKAAQVFLSLTDEPPYAMAQVMITAV